MNLHKTLAYLNRVTPYDWVYAFTKFGLWKLVVAHDNRAVGIYMKPDPKKLSGWEVSHVIRLSEDYFTKGLKPGAWA